MPKSRPEAAGGVLVLAVWVVLWPLYQRQMWTVLIFAAAIPIAAGAALGVVGHRIAATRLGAERGDALAQAQLPWALAGIVLFVFVLPWAIYLSLPSLPAELPR